MRHPGDMTGVSGDLPELRFVGRMQAESGLHPFFVYIAAGDCLCGKSFGF